MPAPLVVWLHGGDERNDVFRNVLSRRDVCVRQGQTAYRGLSLRLREHSGSVHCFGLSVDAPFTIRDTRLRDTRRRGAARADRPDSGRTRHQVIAEDDLARRLRTEPAPDPLTLLHLLTGAGDERDDRIRTALDLLRAHPGTQWTGAGLGPEVILSASQFQHLFTTHTGTSFRRYRLWARMLHVATAVSKGLDLTTADAGFAPPGHYSDSFRTLFGLSVTALLTRTRTEWRIA